MKQICIKIVAVLAGLLVLFGIIINCISFCCFDQAWYLAEYEKLDIKESIGITEEELNNVTNVLLSYTKGEREDLNVSVEINGESVPFFNEREELHMIDVRNLYHRAMIIGEASLLVGLLGLGALCFFKGKRLVYRQYFIANGVFFGLFGALSLFVANHFSFFWLNIFHPLLFPNNDFWLLNPATDRLILLVPEQFFYDLVLRIVLCSIAALVACMLLAMLGKWLWYREKREKSYANRL